MINRLHEQLIKAANELPPMPQAVVRLTEIIADPDYAIKDVVRVVELDPALAGKLLRMANSVMYGSGRVGTISEAIVRVGAGTVRTLALAASVKPKKNLDLSAFGYTPDSYWKHCVAVLCFAEEMAAQRLAHFGDDFTTAALLHDFGQLVLAKHMSPEQAEALSSLDPTLPAVDRESIILGVNHAEVTAVVTQAWNLPETIVKAVQYHHSPEQHDTPLCHGLNLANQLAWQLEERNFELAREFENRLASRSALNVSEDQMTHLLERGRHRMEVAMEVYS